VLQEFEEDDFLVHEDEEDKGDEEGDEEGGEAAKKKKRKKKNKKRRQDLQLDEEDYDLLEDQGIKVGRLPVSIAVTSGPAARAYRAAGVPGMGPCLSQQWW
jgi:hypothetical protein